LEDIDSLEQCKLLLRTILVIIKNISETHKAYANLIKDDYNAFWTGTYRSKINKLTGEQWQPSYDKITRDIENLVINVIRPKTEINRALFVIENGKRDFRGHVHALFKYDKPEENFKTYQKKGNTLIDYSSGCYSRISAYWKYQHGYTYSKPILEQSDTLNEYMTKHAYVMKDTVTNWKRNAEIDRKFFPYIRDFKIDRDYNYSETQYKVNNIEEKLKKQKIIKQNEQNVKNYMESEEYINDEIFSNKVYHSLQYPIVQQAKQIVYTDKEFFKEMEK